VSVDALRISRRESVSREQIAEWGLRWRDAADTEAREALVRSVWPWAIALLAKMTEHYKHHQGEDYLSDAVLNAVDTYSPESGALTSWTAWHVRAMLSRQAKRRRERDVKGREPTVVATDERLAFDELLLCISGLLEWLDTSSDIRARVLADYCRGRSLAEIGRRLRLSRQRVHVVKEQAVQWLQQEFPDTKGLKSFERYAVSPDALPRAILAIPASRRIAPWLRCAQAMQQLLSDSEPLSLPVIRQYLPRRLSIWAARSVIARPTWFARVDDDPLPRWTVVGKEPGSEQA